MGKGKQGKSDMPVMLTVKDGARRLNCTPRRLREAIEAGEVQAIRLGKRYVIAPAVIDRMLQGEPPRAA
jgi:excisionase family DNA binding protein